MAPKRRGSGPRVGVGGEHSLSKAFTLEAAPGELGIRQMGERLEAGGSRMGLLDRRKQPTEPIGKGPQRGGGNGCRGRKQQCEHHFSFDSELCMNGMYTGIPQQSLMFI